MRINGVHSRTIWTDSDNPHIVKIIDQRYLPHQVIVEHLSTVQEAATAIREMHVRGAPLIGATAAYGMYLAAGNADTDLYAAAQLLKATRPTAVDLFHAVDGSLRALSGMNGADEKVAAARTFAERWCDASAEQCKQIGLHGVALIEDVYEKTGNPVQILTHCNAGWMACIDYGTATAPIYQAQAKGIPLHVWVDETRPRNQGSRITAFELGQEGVPHTVITDNTGGHLMQHGKVDLVITGTDRTTRCGDVANKIGTYLKALAAFDNHVPFFVALPSPTIDWGIDDGLSGIPIEERGAEEVKYVGGILENGQHARVLVCPEDSPVANYGFDVTPARLISGLITERGICPASADGLLSLFPEHRAKK
jgi:methylthioribose-1-phosphate isomerase